MGLSSEQMKADWDERAKHGTLRYVTGGLDEAEFDASGVEDAALLLADVMPHLRSHERALDIGCGPGRMLLPLLAHFREAWGTDVSAEMIAQGRRRIGPHEQIRLLETSGRGLDGVPSDHFDFCCSMYALECIGDRQVVVHNFEEAWRVLRVGGLIKFQVAGIYPGNPFRPFYEQRADTWFGARFTTSELARLAEEIGFEVLSTYHARWLARPDVDGDANVEHRLWIVARKGLGMDDWERTAWRGGAALARQVKPGEVVLLADTGMLDLLGAAAGDAVRFMDFSSPADDDEAVVRLESLRSEGCRYLFVSQFKFWWRGQYPRLFEYLKERYVLLEELPECLIFDLSGRA